MTVSYGAVVKSLAGRDKGYLLAVVSVENDKVFVCDGKERPLERPKSKNRKHLFVTDVILDADSMSTNRKLKRALHDISEEVK